MPNKKETSPDMAKIASKTLKDKDASELSKKLAGSVLSQSDKSKDSKAKKK